MTCKIVRNWCAYYVLRITLVLSIYINTLHRLEWLNGLVQPNIEHTLTHTHRIWWFVQSFGLHSWKWICAKLRSNHVNGETLLNEFTSISSSERREEKKLKWWRWKKIIARLRLNIGHIHRDNKFPCQNYRRASKRG